MTETLGDRIRARRDAVRGDHILEELKAHIDNHMAELHARLDKLDKPKTKRRD